jgi:uncharacterized protein GlcG (DUF336 family)
MSKEMNLENAQKVILAAYKEAEKTGVPMNIAVVDAGNDLTAFVRMDNVWLGSIDIAHNKAYTVRAFGMPTKELGAMAQPGQPLFGIETTNGGKIVIFAGGIRSRTAIPSWVRSASSEANRIRTIPSPGGRGCVLIDFSRVVLPPPPKGRRRISRRSSPRPSLATRCR